MSTGTPAKINQKRKEGELWHHIAIRAHYAREALSGSTKKALEADERLFRAWCQRHGLNAFPAAPETICQFLENMAAGEKIEIVRPVTGRLLRFQCGGSNNIGTLRRYRSSISTLHRFLGFTAERNPASAEEVSLCMKALARRHGRRPKQAKGITWDSLQHLLDVTGDDLIGIRDAALISLGYDTMCRRSELVQIRIEDIELGERSGAVLIRRSKNDPEGVGHLRFIALDTVSRIKDWLGCSGIETGPLFRSVRKYGLIGKKLTGYDVGEIIKKLARRAEKHSIEKGSELDLDGVSGHSLRVGAAQDLAVAGLALPEIMQAGGWKTPTMPLKYIENIQVARGAMAKLAKLQGRNGAPKDSG